MHKLQQTVNSANKVKLQHWHIGRLVQSRPKPPQWPLSFPELLAGNEASVQQQQPQNASRSRCMLVHHSNMEIDSNDSLVSQNCVLTKLVSNSLTTTESYKFRKYAFHKTRIFLVNSLGVFGQFSENTQKILEIGFGLIKEKQFFENCQQNLCKC